MVANLVREVTDDKSLPKEARKRLQAERAPTASPAARQIKLADKVCNVRDIAYRPPVDWDRARRSMYLEMAHRVAQGCRGVNARLDAAFDAALAAARAAISNED